MHLLLIAAVSLSGLLAQSPPGFGGSRLRLMEGPDAQLRLQYDGKDLSLPQGSLEQDGVVLGFAGDTLNIKVSGRPLGVESDIGSWSMQIPPDSSVSVRAALSRRMFHFTAPSANRSSVVLTFSDRGNAEMFPGSEAELDLLRDETYAFTASTNVVATTADGQKLQLSTVQPPMFGGELREVTDSRGTARFRRANPSVQLEFRGALDEILTVSGASGDISLIPGEEKQLTFTNGTALSLKHVPARAVLEWRLTKGVCQFKVAGFSCWMPIARSGQSGVMQWNPVRKIIDLKSTSDSPVSVQLSARLHASIGPGATFQYAQFQDCNSFTSSASGGDVYLVSRETGEITRVVHSVSFSEGDQVGAAADRLEGPAHEVSFGWQSDDRFELRDSIRMVGLSPGQDEIIRAGADELLVAFTQSGEITLTATHGTFKLLPLFVPELSFDTAEGAAVVMTLDRRRNLFTARAAETSSVATRVLAAGKTYMFLSGPAKLSVVVGHNTFIPETSASWIFFEGAGGESTFTSGLQPAPLIWPDRFDASRIFQQPVSVLE